MGKDDKLRPMKDRLATDKLREYLRQLWIGFALGFHRGNHCSAYFLVEGAD